MTDQTTPGGAMPPAAGATPTQTPPAPAGTASSTSATQPATGAATTGDDGLGDKGKKALEEERKARRDAEQAARDAQTELEKLRTANLSEEERRTKRLSDLEREQSDWARERQELLLERGVERAAAKLGFADPADAMGLLDRTTLEFDKEGHPRNLDQQLQALAKAKPYLLGQRAAGSFDTGTGSGTRPAAGRIYTRQELRDTTFFAANRDDILLAQRQGRIRG